MRSLVNLGLAFVLSSGVLHAQDPGLYQFGGKTYTLKDLSPALQQTAYDMQRQSYDNLQRVVDAQLFDDYVKSEAQKKKISVEKFEEQVLKSKKVSDKEAKAWFEENKARLGGRSFDTIKKDIVNLLQQQEDEKVRGDLIAKIKKDGKFLFVLPEPKAPVMDINIAGYPSKGNPKAKLTIVEFADYRCPHCRDAAKALKTVFEKYRNKVNFVYLDFPLDKSGPSMKVAEGGVCADQQKKFWEYHYMAFAENNLTLNSPKDFASKLKLDMKAFETCLASAETTRKVEASRAEGERIGITGTPSIFFNGQKISGNNEKQLEETLKKML